MILILPADMLCLKLMGIGWSLEEGGGTPPVRDSGWKEGDVGDWVYLLAGWCHFWCWIGLGGWGHRFITHLVCRSIFLTKSFIFCGIVKKVWSAGACDGLMFQIEVDDEKVASRHSDV